MATFQFLACRRDQTPMRAGTNSGSQLPLGQVTRLRIEPVGLEHRRGRLRREESDERARGVRLLARFRVRASRLARAVSGRALSMTSLVEAHSPRSIRSRPKPLSTAHAGKGASVPVNVIPVRYPLP